MAELINEIISPEAFKQVADMKAELASLTKQMEDMLKVLNSPSSPTGKPPLKDLPKQLKENEEALKQLRVIQNQIVTTNAKLAATETQYGEELAKSRLQLQQYNAELKQNAKEQQMASGSLDQMRANLNKLEKLYSAMSAEMRNAKVGQTIFADMVKAKEGVTLLEQSMGNYKRNVGNYTNSTFQLTQVLREMPAFTYSAQTGFMALSNNLPMLADAFQNVKRETGSTGAALGIFAKSLGSFSNIFTIAITAVTMMIPALTKMFTAMDDTTQSSAKLKEELKSVTQIMNDEISKATSLTAIISNQNMAYIDRTLAFDQLKKMYPDLLKDMTMEQAINEKALDTYGGIIASITVMAQRKAKLAEYEKLIAEQSALQLKYDQARGTMDTGDTFTYTDSGTLQILKAQLDKTTSMVDAYQKNMEREGEALNDAFTLIKGGGKKTDEKGDKSPAKKLAKDLKEVELTYKLGVENLGRNAPKLEFIGVENSQAVEQDMQGLMQRLQEQVNQTPIVISVDFNAKERLEIFAQKAVPILEQIQKITQESTQALGELSASFTARKMQDLDMEQKKIQDNFDAEKNAIEQLSISQEEKTKRITALEAQRAAQQKRIDAERLQAARKQAAIDKGINIMNIITTTALSVMKALAMTPPNIPLSIVNAAIGSAQLAAAIAAPLPQFAKGTDNAPEGFAVVGERGTELVVNPDGTSWLTPAKDTITYLKKGAKVVPNNELMDMVKYANYVNVGGIKQGETGGLFGMALVAEFQQLSEKVDGLTRIMAGKNMSVNIQGNYDHYLHVRKNIR